MLSRSVTQREHEDRETPTEVEPNPSRRATRRVNSWPVIVGWGLPEWADDLPISTVAAKSEDSGLSPAPHGTVFVNPPDGRTPGIWVPNIRRGSSRSGDDDRGHAAGSSRLAYWHWYGYGLQDKL